MPSEGGLVVAEMVDGGFGFVVRLLMVAGVVEGVVVRVVGVLAQGGVLFVAEDGDEGVHSLEPAGLRRLNCEMVGVGGGR
jgi:hypothetical protein